MKKFTGILALITLMVMQSLAQVNESGSDSTFLQEEHPLFVVFLKDTSAVHVDTGQNGIINVISSNEAIQEILNNYTIYRFEMRSPHSRFPVMRQYYVVEASSIDLMNELLEFPSVFPYAAPDMNQPVYTPN